MPDPEAAPERRASPSAGDEDALYRAHAASLRKAVGRRVYQARPELVDDACGFAWLRLLHTHPRRETVFGWLFTVAVHEARRMLAADRREAPLVGILPSGDVAPLDVIGDELDPLAPLHARQRLRAVAEALPERKRHVVALQALGYSYAEIAALTGDTPRTVNRQLARAKRLLDPLREPLNA